MNGLMILLCFVSIGESLLLSIQGDEMSKMDHMIRFLSMENEELKQRIEKDGEKNGNERGGHKNQVTRDDSKGQGAGQGT